MASFKEVLSRLNWPTQNWAYDGAKEPYASDSLLCTCISLPAFPFKTRQRIAIVLCYILANDNCGCVVKFRNPFVWLLIDWPSYLSVD